MHRGEKIGDGTFGVVYAATSPRTGNNYAVKRNLMEEETSFIGVSREVDLLNKLRHHPHIVRLERVAFGQPFLGSIFSPLTNDRQSQRDDTLHFVFSQAEYDLHRFIYGAAFDDYGLIKRYMVHILLGLEYMHTSHIIHRDLKPSNVLIFGHEKDVSGVSNVAQLCDLGMAKPYTYQGKHTPGTVTPWYRAPEIALGYPHYDYKSDVWSAGCVLFEMVAKHAFVEADNNDDQVLTQILRALPQELPLRKFRELVRSQKWRTVRLGSNYRPSRRLSLQENINLTPSKLRQFQIQAGKYDDFCHLLNHMLTFVWEDRYTVTQCLDHPFFNDYRAIIADTRAQYAPIHVPTPIVVHDCIERKWMSKVVTLVFNQRRNLKWYRERAIFQAISLFDRYLQAMFGSGLIPANAVESEYRGRLHDKTETELLFLVCLYLAVKYFSSIHILPSFDSFVDFMPEDGRLTTPAMQSKAEEFEGGLIKNCLQYYIYQPTVYEAADRHNDKLSEVEVRDLIILYSGNTTIDGMMPDELYRYYKEHLKGREITRLYHPLTRP